MSYKYLTVTSYDHVALVTFSHPPHNFMNVEALVEVQHAFETLNADENCRALSASEGKVFCAALTLLPASARVSISSKD